MSLRRGVRKSGSRPPRRARVLRHHGDGAENASLRHILIRKCHMIAHLLPGSANNAALTLIGNTVERRGGRRGKEVEREIGRAHV